MSKIFCILKHFREFKINIIVVIIIARFHHLNKKLYLHNCINLQHESHTLNVKMSIIFMYESTKILRKKLKRANLLWYIYLGLSYSYRKSSGKFLYTCTWEIYFIKLSWRNWFFMNEISVRLYSCSVLFCS